MVSDISLVPLALITPRFSGAPVAFVTVTPLQVAEKFTMIAPFLAVAVPGVTNNSEYPCTNTWLFSVITVVVALLSAKVKPLKIGAEFAAFQ